MKKLGLTALVCCAAWTCSLVVQAQKKDPVLLTVENEKITVSEFEQVYNKNNAVGTNIEQKSVAEYLELYVNFKLKVKEAEALGMDTVAAYRKELDGYIDQLSAPYLVDRAYTESLVKEAYDRLQYDIEASHILIRLDPDPLPADTLQAYTEINGLRQRVLNGESFAAVALEGSEDPSVNDNEGRLGYFTAFRMVYPFESAAYYTPEGEVSQPVRTRYGYHLIRINDKRPAVGEVRVAHIMTRIADPENQEQAENAKKKIDEIYKKLQQGADFAKLARTYSDDKPTAGRGGEIQWFGAGRMVPSFESAAFAIEEDGAYSEPFRTPYGWHIVKRLEKRGIGSYEEEYDAIKQKVERDSRSLGSKVSLVKKLKEEYKVKEYPKNVQAMASLIDSTYFQGEWETGKGSDMNKPVMVINDKQYAGKKTVVTQSEFAEFIGKGADNMEPIPAEVLIDRYFEDFSGRRILFYEAQILEEKYPEYRALVQEYRDGILLFELMNQKVWNKAIEDTTGLEEFYEANKNEFMWDARIQGKIYTCSTPEKAQQLHGQLKEGATDSALLAQLNEDTQLGLNIQKGKFTKEAKPVLEKVNWETGLSTVIEYDGSFVVVLVEEVLDPQPKLLDEARGVITSAYQNYLEEQWIQELRSKYAFEVNEAAIPLVNQNEL